MILSKDSPLFSELERIQQRIQGYSNSFPDVENPKALKWQSLSDRAVVLATRDGTEEIGAQAEFIPVQDEMTGNLTKLVQAMNAIIQAQNEKTRAEADWIRAQAELTRAQAELTRAQAELTQAQAELTRAQAEETRAQAEVTRAKANNQKHDETGEGSESRPRKSLWDKICNIFKMLKDICATLYKFFLRNSKHYNHIFPLY